MGLFRSTKTEFDSDVVVLEGNKDYYMFVEGMRSVIDRMVEGGLDKYIELPMIAVMGDTSSGKSALLSNLAEIELPSSAELTTRCPIMIKMKKSNEWKAKIGVKFKDHVGHGGDFSPITLDQQTWSQIQQSIAQAQKHIITFTQKEVSRDVVDVEIHSPDCIDLTLIDLPGIVRATGRGESETLSPDIQALIDEYMKNDRCIILAVHPSNVDFHNSQIMRDAKKADPQTRRTLPVLTKPDLIDVGAEGGVVDLLLGNKTDGFEHGFHMVKGRGQSDLDSKVSIRGGLSKEERFFETKNPWNTIADRSLLGTKKLREKLGTLLKNLIKSSFGSIVQEIEQKLEEAKEKLSNMGTLPKSDSERRDKFRDIVDNYLDALKKRIVEGHSWDSDSHEISVAAQFYGKAVEFKAAISSTRLAAIDRPREGDDAQVYVGSTLVKGTVKAIVQDNVFIDTYTVGGYEPTAARSSDVFVEGGRVYRKESHGSVELAGISQTQNSLRRDPAWLHVLIEQKRAMRLLLFPNDVLFESIVRHLVETEWRAPSSTLVKDTAALLKTVCISVAEEQNVSTFRSLADFLKEQTNLAIAYTLKETLSSVHSLLSVNHFPFSQDEDMFNEIIRHRSAGLESELENTLNLNSLGDTSTIYVSTIKNAIKTTFQEQRATSIMDLVSGDLQNALAAYGRIAKVRIADEVPMMEGSVKEAKKRLLAASEAELQQLLNVPRHFEQELKDTQEKIGKLNEALDMLRNLRTSN